MFNRPIFPRLVLSSAVLTPRTFQVPVASSSNWNARPSSVKVNSLSPVCPNPLLHSAKISSSGSRAFSVAGSSSGIHCQTVCDIWLLAKMTSGPCEKCTCSHCTEAFSILEVSYDDTFYKSTTYLLTYLLTQSSPLQYVLHAGCLLSTMFATSRNSSLRETFIN